LQKLNTLFIGKVVLSFPKLPSTNAYASDLLAKSRPIEGTVITTDDQTKGRGQIGSKWLSSAKNNLTCSVVLYPKFLQVRQQFDLNIMVSLALKDVVQVLLPGNLIKIKWPNDIYADNKKIAGILIQNSLQGTSIQHTVIGVGLNVKQIEFPSEIPNATSLQLLAPETEFAVETVLFRFCEALEKRYLQLKNNKDKKIKGDYLDHLLGFEKERTFETMDGAKFKGYIQGVTEEGKLIIKSGGELLYFSLKEVAFL
jgi:BirA family biotin operon repressor/biotin-[acetyl-CoA-carboxylase] ligase